ncbi:hypothetical protein VTL71DRAFT_14055 [Oculimacula yallundae]|uniref:Gfd2/YDR514C-like C-terminal domain-containing protein n=1 Tax=Oculimacula yallundae TaxID=86028 RepID=A0ABR4CHD6_9HELO
MFRLPISRTSLEDLIGIFGLGQHEPRDVVLVSLDLEGPRQNRCHVISQIGVSYFDTRRLHHPNQADHHHFATRHFIVGGQRRLAHVGAKYHFGDSEHITSQDGVDDVLRNLLLIPDEKAPEKYRDIVLLAHGISADLATCRKRGYSLEDLTSVVGLLDTAYLARDVLGTTMPLCSLLNILELPSKELHNAGNDANYALRALLVLCSYGVSPLSAKSIGTLDYFKGIAFEPLPDTTERNARLRSLKSWCTDLVPLYSLDVGGLNLFDDA